MIVPIRGLFEAHLTVSDLDRSIGFYRDVLGLPLAQIIPERNVAFFWVPTSDKAMLGLWSIGTSPLLMRLHIAFEVGLEQVLASVGRLRDAGLVPLDSGGGQTDRRSRWCCAGCPRPASISTIPTATRWSSSPCCRTGRGRNWGA